MRLYDDPLAEIQHMTSVARRIHQAINRDLTARSLAPPTPPSTPDPTEDAPFAFWAGALLGFIVGGVFVSVLVEWWL